MIDNVHFFGPQNLRRVLYSSKRQSLGFGSWSSPSFKWLVLASILAEASRLPRFRASAHTTKLLTMGIRFGLLDAIWWTRKAKWSPNTSNNISYHNYEDGLKPSSDKFGKILIVLFLSKKWPPFFLTISALKWPIKPHLSAYFHCWGYLSPLYVHI